MDGLRNISPIDGRYQKATQPLQDYFSEEALIRYRVLVEVEYFIALAGIPVPALQKLGEDDHSKFRSIYLNFTTEDASAVKQIEKTTNHDIKAVEYFLRTKFDQLGYGQLKEYIHFGLTSQDVNNTAIPLSLKDAIARVTIPSLEQLHGTLHALAISWLEIPMLARTHGQPASPTTVGKELLVFCERIQKQLDHLRSLPYPGKFGGATGNFNAHVVSFPNIDWIDFADRFTGSLGLKRSRITTQIDHYDDLAAIFDCVKRICTILIDLDRDCWTYISMDYFGQRMVEGEVGSSAMPHKVNPIDFENSEGNAGIAIALLEHLSAKLPISRLQRDLTDSTVLRNIGVPLAHLLIATKSSIRGLGKITLNQQRIAQDLDQNMAVVAEAIQTILRTLDYPHPYEALKSLTRGSKSVTRESLDAFIDQLDLHEEQKQRLKRINPSNYTGIIPRDIL